MTCSHKFKHIGVYVARKNYWGTNYSTKILYDKYFCEKCLTERYRESGRIPNWNTEEAEKYPRVHINTVEGSFEEEKNEVFRSGA